MAQKIERKRRRTRNIITWSGKGGSGKTTFSQNIAYWLAAMGRIVVLVDTDSFANASNYLNLLTIPEHQRYTLSDVIQKNVALIDAMYQVRKGLYIVPSDDNIEVASNYIVVNQAQEIMIERYLALTETLGTPPETPAIWETVSGSIAPRHLSLQPIEDDQIQERPTHIDYIIWDFPAEINALGRAILKIPEIEIWSPVLLEPLPLQGFAQMKRQLIKIFKNFPAQQPQIAGVIPYSLTHKKKETTEEFVKLFINNKNVFQRAVHEDLNVPPTQNVYPARSIYEVKKTSRAAREFFEIAMRIDGYTGPFEGSPDCKHCNEIHEWLQQQMVTAGEGA